MFFNFDVYVFEFVQSLMFAFYNAFNLIWVEKYNPINGMTRVALDDFVEIFYTGHRILQRRLTPINNRRQKIFLG